jgi:hypothetical protein
MKNNSTQLSVRGNWLAKQLTAIIPSITLALLTMVSPVRAGGDRHVPELPAPVCDSVNAPEGHRVRFRAFALGVQVYAWNGTAWVFQRPEAGLYASPGHHGQIGTHYAGPTWEANDGSKVQAVVAARCTPNPGAIPWLLLQATPLSHHGVFSQITYIQRVNTIGGTAPAEDGSFIGEEARVPYTAEYYFYSSQH